MSTLAPELRVRSAGSGIVHKSFVMDGISRYYREQRVDSKKKTSRLSS